MTDSSHNANWLVVFAITVFASLLQDATKPQICPFD